MEKAWCCAFSYTLRSLCKFAAFAENVVKTTSRSLIIFRALVTCVDAGQAYKHHGRTRIHLSPSLTTVCHLGRTLPLKKPKLGVHTSATIKKRIYFFSISGVPQFVKKNRSLECLELKHTDKSFCQKPGCKFCRNSSFLVRRPSSSWTHYLLDHQERNRVAHPGHVSHDFIESWLINRDPYNGWLWSPHNWIV